MNLQYFIRFFKDYKNPDTSRDSRILFFTSKYKFMGVWDAIPTGTHLEYPQNEKMIDYVGTLHVEAFMLDYRNKNRFITMKDIEYIPDAKAKQHIIYCVLKKEP